MVGVVLSMPVRCAGRTVRVRANRRDSVLASEMSPFRDVWTGFVDTKWTCDQIPKTLQARNP
jgi:hypothetical protein